MYNATGRLKTFCITKRYRIYDARALFENSIENMKLRLNWREVEKDDARNAT